jgi:hypothetical protein
MKAFLFSCLLLLSLFVHAQEIKPSATEDWSVKPPVVTPGKKAAAPSDAIVLFAGKEDLLKWQTTDSTPVKWAVKSGVLQIIKKAGSIQTKQPFGSMQLHMEWRTPDPKEDKGTSRGNSGILFMGLYELQIYESHQYNTNIYYNGMGGSIYKQYRPLVNAALPPLTWQTYDVVFDAPEFNADSSLKKPAYLTVFHNGVLIQNHVELKGPMVYAGYPKYVYHASRLPLMLQEHDSRVSFRNIWLREL